MKIQKISISSPDFPVFLKNIPTPPKQIYVLGDSLNELLKQPRLAVVGSRAITPYGRAVTHKLVEEVAAQGVVIISGLALGLDGEAHRAALNARGKTIAVLPCGLDQICPRSHRNLAAKILEQGGALISEYPVKTEPFLGNFVARNRLVSGLADAVLLPEAAVKSGSLHTAQFALDQGREVLAVPGNITSPTSVGTNNLIKAGATPVTTAQDILNVLRIKQTVKQTTIPLADNPEEQVILQLVGQGVTDATDLLEKSGLEIVVFNQTLTMLEITGRIRAVGSNNWTLL